MDFGGIGVHLPGRCHPFGDFGGDLQVVQLSRCANTHRVCGHLDALEEEVAYFRPLTLEGRNASSMKGFLESWKPAASSMQSSLDPAKAFVMKWCER